MKAHKKLMRSLAALAPRPATREPIQLGKIVPILYKRTRPPGSERRRLAHEIRREAKRNRRAKRDAQIHALFAQMDREDLV
jgi:hypothetical protein